MKYNISITGNRDISLIQKKYIQEELYNLLSSFPNSIKKELLVITPLADGVDRIIADVVLNDFKDIKILVPLPMSESIYKTTFAKGLKVNDISQKQSIKEYDSLISKIKEHNKSDDIYIDLDFDEENYNFQNEDIKRQIRRNQYAILGDFLVKTSDVLIAVYDKSREKKKGGTIEVVEKFKTTRKNLIEIGVENL